MILKHKCKFCAIPLDLELDDDGAESFNLEFLKSLAACNRCADFREKKRILQDRLLDRALEWNRHRLKQVPLNSTDLEKVRSSIVNATKKYAGLVCDFNRVQSLWNEDFAQQIFDQPHKTFSILTVYERGITKSKGAQSMRSAVG